MFMLKRRSPSASNTSSDAPEKPLPQEQSCSTPNISKRLKLTVSTASSACGSRSGTLFSFGSNFSGQLGVSSNEEGERKFPGLVPGVQELKFTQVVCGAMHTVALTNDGKVFTFGCNDDGALGRPTDSEELAARPSQVQLNEKIVQISAGDSHSAALTESGKLYVWGSFRNTTIGDIGLIPGEGQVESPRVCTFSPSEEFEPQIAKVVSGSNHIAVLTTDKSLYTFGDGERGQLGRYITTLTLNDSSPRAQADKFLQPKKVEYASLKNICDISTGRTSTFCTTDNGEVWAFGLNCNSQLGFKANTHSRESNIIYVPRRIQSFSEERIPWTQIKGGEFHTIALNEEGQVFGHGQAQYGCLGLGEDIKEDEHIPTPIKGPLEGRTCVQVACGDSTSYAVTDSGELYAWGFGTNFQLGNGTDDDVFVPTRCKSAQDDEGINGEVIGVSAGAQHVAILIQLPLSPSATKD